MLFIKWIVDCELWIKASTPNDQLKALKHLITKYHEGYLWKKGPNYLHRTVLLVNPHQQLSITLMLLFIEVGIWFCSLGFGQWTT